MMERMGLDYFGEFADIAGLLIRLEEIKATTNLDPACLVLPDDVLPGVTNAYGVTVVRADVPAPMVAFFGVPRATDG